MCVYCRAYLSYALDTMKMSLKTKEKETTLTPCLRTTLWPRELIEFPEYLITSFQGVKQLLKMRTGTKSYADKEFFYYYYYSWKGSLWLIAGPVNEPWVCFGQDHSRQSQGNIPKASAPVLCGWGKIMWKSPEIRPELSGGFISLPFIISKQKHNFSPF